VRWVSGFHKKLCTQLTFYPLTGGWSATAVDDVTSHVTGCETTVIHSQAQIIKTEYGARGPIHF